jgi:hypothetical protein
MSARVSADFRSGRAGAASPALAHHEGDRLLVVEVGEPETDKLARPHTRIEKEPEDRRIAPVLERVASAGREELRDLVEVEDRDLLLRYRRRAHSVHRRPLELAVAHEPTEELLQAQLVLRGRRGLDPFVHVGEVPLEGRAGYLAMSIVEPVRGEEVADARPTAR